MRRPLTPTEWADELRNFERSAFRLELQPAYSIPGEDPGLDRFLAGDLTPPTDLPLLREWFDQIEDLTAQGRRVERVRVLDEPPTDYQRWTRWVGQWNLRAGEHLRYMTRREASKVGLPAASTVEWWLMDNERLVVMRFDDIGHRIDSELVTDPERVEEACTWRDLAVHHSTPDSVRGDHV